MKTQLIIGFSELTEPQFLNRSQAIAGSLPNNVFYPLPWPAQVPAPAAIVTQVGAYLVAYNNAKDGDRVHIKARHSSRISLTGNFQVVAHYLQIVANGDASMLATTGYPLRQAIVKSLTIDPLGAPMDLTVTRAALSGGLNVHARALALADVYNLQIASADPSVEANWSDVATYVHCNRIVVTGLTPNKTYYVRLRGFNKNGHGVWATSAGILVL